MMKKMLFAAVALVLAAGFTACSKEEAAPENIVKVEFAVADKAGFDTAVRAVKTAWAEGDQIMVLFKPTGGDFLIAEESIKELLILQYTGSAWTVANLPTEVDLGSSGRYAAIHYRVPAEKNCGIAGSYNGNYYFTNYAGGEVLYYMGDEAQYTLADGKLNLGTISLAMDEDAIQFSVKNLASVEGEWYLALVDHNWTGSEYIGDDESPTNGFQAQTPAFNSSTNYYLTTFSEEWATPVVNGADRSFFFTADNEWNSATALTFLLQNKATWKTYKYEYKPDPFVMPAVNKAYLLPAFDSGKWVEME